jgi:hypothetical protein
MFNSNVPEPVVNDVIRLSPGSAFELRSLTPGVLRATTTGDSQVVKGFTPVNLDLALQLLEDGRTALTRAHVVYRFGNPTSAQVEEPLRTEVLEEVLGAVHAWRAEPGNARRAGVVTEVPDLEVRLEAATKEVEELRSGLKDAKRELRLAQSRHDILISSIADAKATRDALKGFVKPVHLMVQGSAAPLLPRPEEPFNASGSPWYVFIHAMGGDMVAVRATDEVLARHAFGAHMGFGLDSEANHDLEFGQSWTLSESGPRDDGSYDQRPEEDDVLGLLPRSQRPWDRTDRVTYIEAPEHDGPRWHVFTHCMGERAYVVEAGSSEDATAWLEQQLGYELDSEENWLEDSGQVWSKAWGSPLLKRPTPEEVRSTTSRDVTFVTLREVMAALS